jgi:hypothetical protein
MKPTREQINAELAEIRKRMEDPAEQPSTTDDAQWLQQCLDRQRDQMPKSTTTSPQKVQPSAV